MPIIQVELLEGRAIEAKRAFAADVTQAAAKHFSVTPDRVRIIFRDMPKENYAVAGVLSSDADKKDKKP
jgi:4-oxalocrotonate tautomerase